MPRAIDDAAEPPKRWRAGRLDRTGHLFGAAD